MSDKENTFSRRNVLKVAGGSIAAMGTAGLGSASGEVEVNVGFSSERGRQAALDEANETVREFDSIDAMTIRLPQQAASALRTNPHVRYVEQNGTVQAHAQTLPWGVDRVDADVAHSNGETGHGADIAVLDTGIDDDHPDLEANLGEGKDFTGKGTWDDGNGHGTHCAGIADAVNNGEGVVGVSTEATLHAGKVLGDDGSGSFSDVAAGIEWAADQGYDVASLSLGASSGSSTLQDAVQYAYDNGVLVVSSAGNSGPCTDCVGYPAAYSDAMAVSSTDSDDSLSSFSSTGSEVELAAPGGSIYSTYAGGGYDTLSGTSMSCPHVSGAGAQLMANGASNTEARSTLKNTAEDIGLASNEQGAGLLDVEAALGGDGGSNSSPSCTLVEPSDGDAVSGTVTVRADASDSEDDDTNLDVGVSIDGRAWQSATYDSTSGYYEYDWDSTAVSDGDHTVQARATDSDGATTESSRISVTVDNTASDNAPSIDQFVPTDDSNPAWTRYDVDWSVSDGDGDLADVTSEMLDSSGSVVASESNAVGGASASGTDYLKTKGSASEIRLTVTDEAGNSSANTKSI
ncbi:S8 family serine peptidase [Halorussus salinisoli]|uniref:S8 family serine peptidase n=1 Tax=Halorussus salinisoli TaxID=2558242 RepID=UPI0010C17D16|nr:S8 family serine peptidase [Halorussus salinisoli]